VNLLIAAGFSRAAEAYLFSAYLFSAPLSSRFAILIIPRNDSSYEL
jgi:hypothetical protein